MFLERTISVKVWSWSKTA